MTMTTRNACILSLSILTCVGLAGCPGGGGDTAAIGNPGDPGTPADPGDPVAPATLAYPVVDTAQTGFYDNASAIAEPAAGAAFHGQDAQVTGNAPSYTDNGDGTVLDNVTGLLWQQSPDLNGDGRIDSADKKSPDAAGSYCAGLELGGRNDWRLPSLKELYSLIVFSGTDASAYVGTDTSVLTPFIDTRHFAFGYGDSAVERIIDAQYASATRYVSTTMDGNATMFGVNFADGRIKGYPTTNKTYYVRCVQGADYGVNQFVDNQDGTVTDQATGLMWARQDSGQGLDWQGALAWVAQKNAENHLGHADWRLPDVKELQSLVDYGRSPDTTASAAIDALFAATAIVNEAGQIDYPAYWSGTSHVMYGGSAGYAAYVVFGRAMGYWNGHWTDVHGAGAQRSDPKAGNPSDYPTGHGPQGDAVRIYNYVRLVRDAG